MSAADFGWRLVQVLAVCSLFLFLGSLVLSPAPDPWLADTPVAADREAALVEQWENDIVPELSRLLVDAAIDAEGLVASEDPEASCRAITASWGAPYDGALPVVGGDVLAAAIAASEHPAAAGAYRARFLDWASVVFRCDGGFWRPAVWAANNF